MNYLKLARKLLAMSEYDGRDYFIVGFDGPLVVYLNIDGYWDCNFLAHINEFNSPEETLEFYLRQRWEAVGGYYI